MLFFLLYFEWYRCQTDIIPIHSNSCPIRAVEVFFFNKWGPNEDKKKKVKNQLKELFILETPLNYLGKSC